MSKVYISLDIGGTKLIVAAFKGSGTVLKQERAATPLNLTEGLDFHRNTDNDEHTALWSQSVHNLASNV